jgi:hypothetical protein
VTDSAFHPEDIARAAIDRRLELCVKDDALNDPDLLPPPDEVAAEVVESLEAALASFRSVAARLQGQ